MKIKVRCDKNPSTNWVEPALCCDSVSYHLDIEDHMYTHENMGTCITVHLKMYTEGTCMREMLLLPSKITSTETRKICRELIKEITFRSWEEWVKNWVNKERLKLLNEYIFRSLCLLNHVHECFIYLKIREKFLKYVFLL